MKKIIAIILSLLTVALLFTGCAPKVVAVSDESEGEYVTVPTVTVSGTGRLTVDPDMATLSLGVYNEADTAEEAAKANADTMKAVTEAVRSFGVKDEDMQTQNYWVSERYDNNGQSNGFCVENTLSVKYYELDTLGKVMDAAIAAGSNRSWGVSFGLKDSSQYNGELAEKAAKDAKSQADAYAAAFGLKAGDIVSISTVSMSEDPVIYRNYKEMPAEAEAAAPDYGTGFSAGTLDLYATVNVRFALAG